MLISQNLSGILNLSCRLRSLTLCGLRLGDTLLVEWSDHVHFNRLCAGHRCGYLLAILGVRVLRLLLLLWLLFEDNGVLLMLNH